MPNIVSQGSTIPWPGGVGTTGTIDLHNLMSGIAGAQANRSPSGYSGAYLALKNDTDSTLLMTWDVSKTSFHLIAGEPMTIPIRQQDTKLNWVVTQQNVAQAHTSEILYSTFIDPADVAAGYPITGGSIVNPSTPAAAIGPGPLPVGVTVLPIQVITDGIQADDTFGGGADYFFPTNLHIVGSLFGSGGILVIGDKLSLDSAKITSDGAGNLSIATGGALNTPRVNYQGTLSASNKIQDLQQGYQYFSDNTDTFGTTRNWLDGPDRGSFQLGPRSGSNYFDWIRLRATRITFDLGKNTSPNTILFDVQGGPTHLDTGTITTDGAGNITSVSLTASAKVKGAQVETPTVQATGGITGIGGTGATRSVDVDGTTAGQITIAASDDGGGHASGLSIILRALTSAAALISGLVVQPNGSTQRGVDDDGTKRLTQDFVGTTDPAGRTGITVGEGDTWTPI